MPGAQSFQRVLSAAALRIALLSETVTAAVTGTATPAVQMQGLKQLTIQAVFTYGSAGTTAKYWIQTSLDGGVTWIDVAQFAFATATATKVSSVFGTVALAAGTTPTDGTLADNTILNGLLGDIIRVKRTTVGTYAGGTTIAISALAR